MNFSEASEINNTELGVLLTAQTDKEAFDDAMVHCRDILNEAVLERTMSKPTEESTSESCDTFDEHYIHDGAEFISKWNEYLTKKFSKIKFGITEGIINANDFPVANIDFSTSYGFVTLKFKTNIEKFKILKDKEFSHLKKVFKNYRLYWNNSGQIMIYHSKYTSFSNLEENIKYCAEGLEKISAELKRMFVA